MKPLLLPFLIIVAVLAFGGWRSIRNSFGREAVHEITRNLFHK